MILDDATSEIYYALLVEEKSTLTVMAGLREVIERKGVFCALYSDRGSHFFYTPAAGDKFIRNTGKFDYLSARTFVPAAWIVNGVMTLAAPRSGITK